MDDLISRSDAIGAVKEERFPIDSDYAEGFMAALDKVEWILKEWLPPAQPQKRTEERTETHGVCLDAIDRQAVIDTVRKIILGFFDDEDGVMNDTEKTLLSVSKAVCNGVRELPSARPEVLACGEGELSAQSDIVRCEDCRHWKQETFNDGYCIEMDLRMCDADFYCGYAERKTDG